MSASIASTAVPYAMMALSDDKLPITAENIEKLLTASGISVEPIWISVFVDAFKGKDLSEFLTDISAGAGSGAAAPAAAAGSAAAAPAAEAKKEEEKESESDEEMGMGLFD